MRSSSELRRGDTTAVYSDDNTFLTPANGAGQMVLPGDSGGPTFQSGALAGVNDFMRLDLSGGGQVSVPAAREWILATTATFTNYIPSYPAGWNFGLPSAWKTITGDFNGDGRTDYARLGGTYAHLFLSNGDGTFSNPIQSYPSGWDFGLPSSWETITGDFNGDGRTDYARLGGTYAHLFISNGDGTFSNPIQRYPAGWDFGLPSGWKTITGDFNGDGRTDYARLGASYTHLFISNGDGTFAAPIESYPSGWNFGLPSNWEPITGDFRGNKKTGYMRLGGTYAHLFMVDYGRLADLKPISPAVDAGQLAATAGTSCTRV